MTQKSIQIGLDPDGYRVTLELQIENGRLSITGFGQWRPQTDYNYCGQIQDTVRKDLSRYRRRFISTQHIRAILAVWDKWHLNDMHAGTESQDAILARFAGELAERSKYPASHYTIACEILGREGLLIDNGYKYGTAWLKRDLPADVEARALALFEPHCDPALFDVAKG